MEGFKGEATAFKAFCSEYRLQVLAQLRRGERCACDLLESVDVSQPNLSHHMRVLRDAGVVRARQEGRWTYYSLDPAGAERVRHLMDKGVSTMYEEARPKIIDICLKSTSTDPVRIAKRIMALPEVPVNGPVHHLADGAALLAAIRNAGADVELEGCLEALFERGSAMPGAICGQWGVCGSAASVGAALATWHGTGPMSDDGFYADNMELASRVLAREAELGGPRCCKRNAFTALLIATDFVRERYGIDISTKKPVCGYFDKSNGCTRERCPYYPL